MHYNVRSATIHDLQSILAMYDHSRSLMRASGNMNQWIGYPTADYIEADISAHASYIVEHQGTPVGTFAVVPGIEPTYGIIVHGRWIDTTTPYATVHRMAKAPGAENISQIAFDYAKKLFSHLRADTHADNSPMLHMLDREGFVHCGTVFMDDGGERLAYEWWRYDSVPLTLQQYIEEQILPQYDNFDAAHRRDHARRVIARAMQMQPDAASYTAAAMHDLGLAFGREEHHLHSGTIIRNDSNLGRWFSAEQIETIAQAAEDHRASATTPPHSMLGCIIAEADRDVEPETIVRRTIEYGLSHYPTLDRNGHWQRTLQHLDEKYSEQGYIKLWLPDSPNAAPLAELRQLIDDRPRLQQLFDNIFNNISVLT